MSRHGMDAARVELEKYTKACYELMKSGIEKKQDKVPMIPTYLHGDKPVPQLKKAAVIDAGGTNFRTALAHFENGECVFENLLHHQMPGTDKPSDWAEFISFCADCIEPLLEQTDEIGFCFSYPAEVTPERDSRVLSLTKQVKILGAEGKLLGAALNDELVRRGMSRKKIVVLNDTPATLLGGSALLDKTQYGGFIGMVAGTGVNSCCMLPECDITKLCMSGSEKMLINLESGSVDVFPRGDFDLEMDADLPDTGEYVGEKMCSGYYLGELCRYTLRAAAKENIFSEVAAEYLIGLEKLTTPEVDGWVSGKTPACFSDEDAENAVYIIQEIFDRAARCMACVLCAILMLTGEGKEKPVCIAVDGSLFKKSRLFRPMLEKYMTEYAEKVLCRSFEFVTNDETSLLGTVAAVLLN